MLHVGQWTLESDGNFSCGLYKAWVTDISKKSIPIYEVHDTKNWLRFLDPLFFGEYPLSMQRLVGKRLPEISPKTAKFLLGSLDFVGINHYTTLYARNDRTRIRKFILRDASSDAAVITTCKMPSHYLLHLKIKLNKSQLRYERINMMKCSWM